MVPFGAAVEAHDIEAAIATLAPDVRFRSPVVFRPYEGREDVGTLLRAVSQVFEDFRYSREIASEDGLDHVLVFETRVGEREVEGADFIRLNDAGEVQELFVMVRPMSGMMALAAAMQEKLAQAGAIEQAPAA
jgi:limonene-1,2-epoxide hydrolase